MPAPVAVATSAMAPVAATVFGLRRQVIVAVPLIFFYLASVVVPLFVPPDIESRAQFAAPGTAARTTVALSGEEQREISARLGEQGDIAFFRCNAGALVSQATVPLPASDSVTAFDMGERATYSVGYGLSNGGVSIDKHGYAVTFPGGEWQIAPSVEFPCGEVPLPVDPRGTAIRQLSILQSYEGSTVAAL